MRHFMNLLEATNSEDGPSPAPDQHSFKFMKSLAPAIKPEPDPLPEDDIDYEGNWQEILEWPDTASAVSVEEQIRRALQASEATPLALPGTGQFYITDEYIIEMSGDSGTVTRKSEWLDDADPDTYFPDYEAEWNNDFWAHPYTLYHATTEDNVASILKHGLSPADKTRGISNRGVGHAIFTTSEFEETAEGSYGDSVFQIDTGRLAKSPDRPYASQEPDIVRYDLMRALAHKIGCEEYETDVEGGISPDTVILHGSVPPEYLTLLD